MRTNVPASLGFPCWLRGNFLGLLLCQLLPTAAPGLSWLLASMGQSPLDIQLLEGAGEKGEKQGRSRAQPLLDSRECSSRDVGARPFLLAQSQQPRAWKGAWSHRDPQQPQPPSPSCVQAGRAPVFSCGSSFSPSSSSPAQSHVSACATHPVPSTCQLPPWGCRPGTPSN